MTDPVPSTIRWTVEDIERRWREVASTPGEPFCILEDGPRRVETLLSPAFVRAVARDGVEGPLLWKALKNLRYGWDPARAMSKGGRDGVFRVSRDFRPRNAMTEKLYERFADTLEGAEAISRWFGGPGRGEGVRVVSHGLRLLGFVGRDPLSVPSFGARKAPRAKVSSKEKTKERWRLALVDVDVNRR